VGCVPRGGAQREGAGIVSKLAVVVAGEGRGGGAL